MPERFPRPARNRPALRRWVALLALGSCGCAILLGILLAATPWGGRGLDRLRAALAARGELPPVVREVEVRKVEVREVEVPVPGRSPGVGASSYDARQLFNGIRLEAKVEKTAGRAASFERVDEGSYVVDLTLRVRAPKPVATLEGLAAQQSRIHEILPGLAAMLPTAVVAPYFDQIYANKEQRLRRDLLLLNRVLSRHNYFDCETILQLAHPETGRRVLLVQSEMDVVSDGSDGDRLPEMPQSIVESDNYQPSTSYRWPKQTETPNPLLAGIEKRLKQAEEDYAVPGLTAERNRQLRATLAECKARIVELKTRSFLIAEYDPFIVLPVFLVTDRSANPFAPRIGDYAVVLHDGRAYPAIVGDAGPDFKTGEASLRIAREIQPGCSPYVRPINDLKATYLVFPGTVPEEKKAPDYAAWHARCTELLGEIGGLGGGVVLHQWDDVLKRLAEEREAKRLAEEEAKRKAEEEAKRKAAEEEARRRAEAEAPRPVPQGP